MNKRRRYKAKARRKAKARHYEMRWALRCRVHRGLRGYFTDADLAAYGQDWN